MRAEVSGDVVGICLDALARGRGFECSSYEQ